MQPICGLTFAPFARRGRFATPAAKESLRRMRERTAANFVIFVPGGRQQTPQSEAIAFADEVAMADEELIEMIRYAKSLGLRVAVKPTVNCMNGTWRAHISFFEEDVPCEPKWGNWFRSYTDFQLHYAKIAQAEGVEMFIAGCEMVMSEHREQEWRRLIGDIRKVYEGPVTYNTDKYQEHNVRWWDCVDWICSSGYYPTGDWERQLDRIQQVVERYQKPFFFAETGCMSVAGSPQVPNDWMVRGPVDLDCQAAWFEEMLTACEKRDWVRGMCFWSWRAELYPEEEAAQNGDYEMYAKPVEAVIRRHYQKMQEGTR